MVDVQPHHTFIYIYYNEWCELDTSPGKWICTKQEKKEKEYSEQFQRSTEDRLRAAQQQQQQRQPTANNKRFTKSKLQQS